MAFSKTLTKRTLPLAAGQFGLKHLFQPFQPLNRSAPFKSLKLTESVPNVSILRYALSATQLETTYAFFRRKK